MNSNLHHMQRIVIILSVFLSALPLFSKGSLDDIRYNQFTVMHDGVGTLDALWYELHPSYRTTAHETNLAAQRAAFLFELRRQPEKAALIDSLLSKRAAEEALSIAEHKLDVAWMTESGRLSKQLDNYRSSLATLSSVGGSADAQSYFALREKGFCTALRTLQDSYQPNSYKKREYTALYTDLLSANDELCRYISYCRASRTSKVPTTSCKYSVDHQSIAVQARQRWLSAAATASH